MENITRNQIMSQIHAYGRARAEADYTLGRLDLSNEEIVKRFNRCTEASNRVDVMIHSVVKDAPLTLELVSALSEFAIQLQAYGTYRHEGHGPAAALDVLDALNQLIRVSKMEQAKERAA